MKSIKLNDGNEIPQLGFGTYQLYGEDAYKSVLEALKIGYRHIDTADRYGNHDGVGRAIRDSGIVRSEIFLTSKIWRTEIKYDDVLNFTPRFLKELSVEYLDLLLVHWPNRDISVNETFSAFEKLKEDGLIRSYGVSNYTENHINNVMDEGFLPVINQVEMHPSLNQLLMREYCAEHNIEITAFSPLAQGFDLKIGLIEELSEKYEKSSSQVILNWMLKQGVVVIPRSSNPNHIKDNFEAADWELSEDDIEKIEGLNKNNRVIDPSFSDFDY